MLNRLIRYLKPVYCISMGFVTLIFAIVPECVFCHGFIEVRCSQETIIICNRIWCILAISLLSWIGITIYKVVIPYRIIRGNNYKIVVEYGDILKKQGCKKVIAFDECFTTKVGQLPQDIKPDSICGQFLALYPNINIQTLINSIGLKPLRKGSAYNGNVCYESGRIVPYNDFLLLAFAKLDNVGILVMR